MRHESVHRTVGLPAAVVCASLAILSAAPAAAESLTLRVNDAMGEPGGRAAVVVRTYAPRGVEEGQICLRATSRLKADTTPFAMLEEAIVYSGAGDAVYFSAFDEALQAARVDFSSASASINESDGPLAVFFFRLRSSLAGGEKFEIAIDLADTALVGADGQPVPLDLRSGVLTIREPGSPVLFAAEGDAVTAGSVAALGIDTQEAFSIGAGRAVLTYDPAFATGPPVVTLDPRHGDAFFFADTTVAGRIDVTFQSPGGTLNGVPGTLFSIRLPTAPSLPVGSQTVVALDPDPASTWLQDAGGVPISVAVEPGTLEITAGSVFADGFESGGLEAWSAASP